MSLFFSEDPHIVNALGEFAVAPLSEIPLQWTRLVIFANRTHILELAERCYSLPTDAFFLRYPTLEPQRPLFNDASSLPDKQVIMFTHNQWYFVTVTSDTVLLIHGCDDLTLMNNDILVAPHGMDPLSRVILDEALEPSIKANDIAKEMQRQTGQWWYHIPPLTTDELIMSLTDSLIQEMNGRNPKDSSPSVVIDIDEDQSQ